VWSLAPHVLFGITHACGRRMMVQADARILRWPGRAWLIGAAVLVLIGTWLFATPANAGPDEAGHLVRGIAVIDRQPVSTVVTGPAWVVFPDVSCYALYGDRPASCAQQGDEPVEVVDLGTRAQDYPIWGHIAPGLALKISTPNLSPYLPRLFSALLPGALVAAGLIAAARRSALGGGVGLLALTPMAWFTFAVVNPSSLVLAGAFAVWIVLTIIPGTSGSGRSVLRYDWILAVGLAALLLPRRDSAIWAALVLVAGCAAIGTTVWARIRAVQFAPRVLILVSTLLVVGWAATVGFQALGLVALAFTVVVVYDAWSFVRPRVANPIGRWLCDAAAAGVLGASFVVAMASRPGGLDWSHLRSLVGQTLPNLREAVGAVGTLDALTPGWAFGLYIATLFVLLVSANWGPHGPSFRRSSVVGVGVAVLAVVSAWVLEMAQGNTSGTYWQGRYYLPVLMGVPLLFAMPLCDARRNESPGRPGLRMIVGATPVLVSIATFVVALRRWGVGTSGSWNPTHWDTYDAPLSPVVLLVVHSVVIVALALLVGAADSDGEMSTQGERGLRHEESLASP